MTTRQAATRPAAPGLRLNRRGRLVAWTLFAAVVFGGLGLGRAVADDPPAPIEVRSYTVAAGDTLWDISAGVTAPGQDVRDVVAQVRDLNGLAGSVIVVGDRLLLPTP